MRLRIDLSPKSLVKLSMVRGSWWAMSLPEGTSVKKIDSNFKRDNIVKRILYSLTDGELEPILHASFGF